MILTDAGPDDVNILFRHGTRCLWAKGTESIGAEVCETGNCQMGPCSGKGGKRHFIWQWGGKFGGFLEAIWQEIFSHWGPEKGIFLSTPFSPFSFFF